MPVERGDCDSRVPEGRFAHRDTGNRVSAYPGHLEQPDQDMETAHPVKFLQDRFFRALRFSGDTDPDQGKSKILVFPENGQDGEQDVVVVSVHDPRHHGNQARACQRGQERDSPPDIPVPVRHRVPDGDEQHDQDHQVVRPDPGRAVCPVDFHQVNLRDKQAGECQRHKKRHALPVFIPVREIPCPVYCQQDPARDQY